MVVGTTQATTPAGLPYLTIPMCGISSMMPTLFVRKRAKDYGTCRLAEGGDVTGRCLLIVEDVVTSGGQVLASCEELRRLGGTVEHALCVIDREAGGREALHASGVELHALFRRRDLDGALDPIR